MFRFDLGSLVQGQPRVVKLKVLATNLLLKNTVYLQNNFSCPFTVDTSCIWPQMRPWSSLSGCFKNLICFSNGLAISKTN